MTFAKAPQTHIPAQQIKHAFLFNPRLWKTLVPVVSASIRDMSCKQRLGKGPLGGGAFGRSEKNLDNTPEERSKKK